ncbi:MAG: hypothetical protein EPN82_06100 [Bacteroidetes bacterium]|nr:MAG: hypothetical protein EPN82_06100 [Bacteroidota bacterium]
MKKIFLILTLFLLCSISNNKLNATNWWDCYETWSMGCLQWSIWTLVIGETVVLDDFPLCTLTVDYFRRECQNPIGQEQIYIYDYSFTGEGCAGLYQYLHPGGQINVDPVKNKYIKDKIFRNISKSRFLDVKDLYPCPNTRKTYSGWEGLCTSVCELEFTDGSTGYFTIDCVTDYCCGIIIGYCWNRVTNQLEYTEQHIGEQSMNCWVFPASPCPGEGEKVGGKTVSRLLSSSGCESTCVFE